MAIKLVAATLALLAAVSCSSSGSSVAGRARFEAIMATRGHDARTYNRLGHQAGATVDEWVSICAALSQDDADARRELLATEWPTRARGAAEAIERALARERNGFNQCADASDMTELQDNVYIPNIGPQLEAMRKALGPQFAS